jgi:hypothetical protein
MRNLHMNYHARSDSKGLELYYNNLKDSLNEVYVELRKDFFSQDLKEEGLSVYFFEYNLKLLFDL